jgi:TRAP transporter TAXI family solute receptor
VLVDIPESIIAKVGPPYGVGVIPKGTYTGQDADVRTATVINFLATHSRLSDAAVYNMTKAIFDNIGVLKAAHSAAKAIDVKTALAGMPVPLHPGAARYFKEAGILK